MRAMILLLAAALWCGMVDAQVPRKLNYQGFLTSPSGTPVNASLSMVFKLYDATDTELYSETQTAAVNNGVFDLVLGAVTPLNLPFDGPYYLGVAVGADPEMTPRQLVTASPYSLRAANADALAPAATVAGAQISGAITNVTATLPAGNLIGPIGTAQVADNAVTQAKLSPTSGAAAGKVLGTNGSTLQWQTAGVGTVTSVGTGSGDTVLMTLTNGSPGGLPAVTGLARAQTFTSTSDRNAKEAFAAVNGGQVLAALVQMPLQSWKYRNEDAAVRHIGPTAQDFRAAFGIGYDDKTIATVDADGVALAAIQGLNAKLEEKDAQVARQQAEIDALKQSAQAQNARIAELEYDRRAQMARIDALEQQASELATLRRQVAQLAQLQQQTAGRAQAAGRFGPLETTNLAAAR